VIRNHRSAFLLTTVLLLAQIAAQADVVSPGSFVRGVPNDNDWPGGESPNLAIDDNVNTKFLHFKGEIQPTGLQVTPLAGATVVTELTFTTANDAPERDPVAFELSGSNVSIDGPYTLIAGGDIPDFAQATAWPRFTKNTTAVTFANTVAYAHYQLLFTKVRNAAGANSMQIAEVELVGASAGQLPPGVDPGDTEDPVGGPSVVISEFKAINETEQSTMVQGKAVYPDWIEIQNRGTAAVNLGGWYLTDDPCDLTKWKMPAVQVVAGGFFLVYASGIQEEDHPENWPYKDASGAYHTNFTLDADGEYLALVSPDGQVVHEYGSRVDGTGFPPQRLDLSYGLYGNQQQYFIVATPGGMNIPGSADISDNPIFSRDGGTYSGAFFLELSSPSPTADIRYTLDGQMPAPASIKYTAPIPISGTREILARAYEAGKMPSEVISRTYVALANDVVNFNSDLPIVIVDTSRQGIGSALTKVQTVIIDRDEQGRAKITGAPDFSGRGGIKRRGSSTSGQAKTPYTFEVWDENNRDRDVPILGLPADSDWVLYPPFSFDRVLINNAFVYDLSNQIGRYAVRTRFVEMYVNANDDTVSASDYVGLYILMEKIKRGEDRVNVEKLEPWDSTEPKIAGGYMLKIDRPDPGDSGFRTARGNPTYGDGTFCYVDPKQVEITTAQSNWIRAYLNNFETALYGPNSADPQTGYAKYIDVMSFIDHNLLNMLAMNVDALRLSTHLHKTRNGKLEMGPLWDFDRALDSTDGRDDNAQSWHGTGDGTDYLNYVWWDQLFKDSNFWQKYIDRWFVLRQGPFSTTSLNTTIDSMADEIREAQARNYAKWPGAGPRYGSFQGEVNHLKQWLQTRCTWIDSQFVAPPQILPAGGHTEAGVTVTLTNPRTTGVLYYTLDGSDPRPFDAASTAPETTTLVAEKAAKRVLVPTAAVTDAWKRDPAFDDSTWISGTGGVGYERDSGYQNYFSIDVGAQMYSRNASCLIRVPFVVSGDLTTLSSLTLKVRYDDGFVAYLNGVEVGRALFSGEPTWNSVAYSTHADFEATAFEEFNISAYAGLLCQGQNLLAIQAMNSPVTSSDFLLSVELVAGMNSASNDNGLSDAVHMYTGPFTVTQDTQVKTRVLVASNPYSPWSGLAQAVFTIGPAAESLRINEIMYNPDNAPDAEYVELLNTSNSTLTLYDAIRGVSWRFTDDPDDPAIDVLFPTDPPVTVAPGECLLLVKDLAAFNAAFSVPDGVQILEWGNGRLANSGDTIQVSSPGDEGFDGKRLWVAADHVTYSDGSHPETSAAGVDPWPPQADGKGMALSRIDAEADGNDPANWRAAVPSPGVAE
jgi:hypothetical protein